MLQHFILKDLVAFSLRQVNKDPMEAWGPTIPHPRKLTKTLKKNEGENNENHILSVKTRLYGPKKRQKM